MTREARQLDNLAHRARLLQAMGGSGAGWEYHGECVDRGPKCDGVCACGHAGLRYEFTLHHISGRTLIVGSTCIETVPALAGETLERVQADAARLWSQVESARRRAEAARKRAALDARVADARTRCDAILCPLEAQIAAMRRVTSWLPPKEYYQSRRLYGLRQQYHAAGRMKSARGQLARYASLLQDLARIYGPGEVAHV